MWQTAPQGAFTRIFDRINILDEPDESWHAPLRVLASADYILVITQTSYFYANKTAFYMGMLNYRQWQKTSCEKVYIIEKSHPLYHASFVNNFQQNLNPPRGCSIVSIQPILDKIYQFGMQGSPPLEPSRIAIVPNDLQRSLQLPIAPWRHRTKWLMLHLGNDFSFIYFRKLGISLSIYQIECLHKLSMRNLKPVAIKHDSKLPYIVALPYFPSYLFLGPFIEGETGHLTLLCVRNGTLVNRDAILQEVTRNTVGTWLYKVPEGKVMDLKLSIAYSTPDLNLNDEYDLHLFETTIQGEFYSANPFTTDKPWSKGEKKIYPDSNPQKDAIDMTIVKEVRPTVIKKTPEEAKKVPPMPTNDPKPKSTVQKLKEIERKKIRENQGENLVPIPREPEPPQKVETEIQTVSRIASTKFEKRIREEAEAAKEERMLAEKVPESVPEVSSSNLAISPTPQSKPVDESQTKRPLPTSIGYQRTNFPNSSHSGCGRAVLPLTSTLNSVSSAKGSHIRQQKAMNEEKDSKKSKKSTISTIDCTTDSAEDLLDSLLEDIETTLTTLQKNDSPKLAENLGRRTEMAGPSNPNPKETTKTPTNTEKILTVSLSDIINDQIKKLFNVKNSNETALSTPEQSQSTAVMESSKETVQEQSCGLILSTAYSITNEEFHSGGGLRDESNSSDVVVIEQVESPVQIDLTEPTLSTLDQSRSPFSVENVEIFEKTSEIPPEEEFSETTLSASEDNTNVEADQNQPPSDQSEKGDENPPQSVPENAPTIKLEPMDEDSNASLIFTDEFPANIAPFKEELPPPTEEKGFMISIIKELGRFPVKVDRKTGSVTLYKGNMIISNGDSISETQKFLSWYVQMPIYTLVPDNLELEWRFETNPAIYDSYLDHQSNILTNKTVLTKHGLFNLDQDWTSFRPLKSLDDEIYETLLVLKFKDEVFPQEEAAELKDTLSVLQKAVSLIKDLKGAEVNLKQEKDNLVEEKNDLEFLELSIQKERAKSVQVKTERQ